MIEFQHHHRSRSFLVIASAIFALAFGIGSIVSADPIFIGFGVIFVAVALCLSWSIYKADVWSMRVVEGVLTWHYPPSGLPATGSLPLAEVVSAVINEDLNFPELTATLRSGEIRKIQLMNSGAALHEYLEARYPKMALHYIPSTG